MKARDKAHEEKKKANPQYDKTKIVVESVTVHPEEQNTNTKQYHWEPNISVK